MITYEVLLELLESRISIIPTELKTKAPAMVNEKSRLTWKNFIGKPPTKDQLQKWWEDGLFEALRCTIGYLIHQYKSSTYPKAIIFTENNIDTETASGGSGKGLLMQSINKVRNIVKIDGKTFNPKSPFAYQNMENDTDVLFIDDVKQHFDFTNLFSIITEGMSYEKKNAQRVNLSPEESPKIVISSNYGITGDTGSDVRRKYEMELSSFYNQKHRPIDDFKQDFFKWDKEQWNLFYNCLFMFASEFLNNNNEIPEYISDSIEFKKLIVKTSQEFYEFASELPVNTLLHIDNIYNDFIEVTNLQKSFSKIKLGKWLNEFCKYKNYELRKESKNTSGKTAKFYHLININDDIAIENSY